MKKSPQMQLEVKLHCPECPGKIQSCPQAVHSRCFSHPDALEQLIANAQRIASQVRYIWNLRESPWIEPRFFKLAQSLQQLYRTDAAQEIENAVLAPRNMALWNQRFSELLGFAKEGFGGVVVLVEVDLEVMKFPLECLWTLERLGAQSLHFLPCQEARISADAWFGFLKELFECWLLGGHHLKDVEPVVSLLQAILCHEEGTQASRAAQSSFQLSVCADGDVYTHLSAADTPLRLGTIFDDELFEMMASPQMMQLQAHWAQFAALSCGVCTWQQICWAEALKDRVAPFSAAEEPCNARRQLYGHIARRLREQLPASFPGLDWCFLSPRAE